MSNASTIPAAPPSAPEALDGADDFADAMRGADLPPASRPGRTPKKSADKPAPRSENQAAQTPRDLLDAVEARFGKITSDLAATRENAACDSFICPEEDSLKVEWPRRGVLWLNPPFSEIGPWAQKCADWACSEPHPSSVLLFLVPASVDALWWAESVRGYARVLALAPRIKFVGHAQGFPKPMVLCVYDPRFKRQPDSVDYWRWKP